MINHGAVGIVGDVVAVGGHLLVSLVHVLVHHSGRVERKALEGIHGDQDGSDIGLHLDINNKYE